jgi:hypothetical protein
MRATLSPILLAALALLLVSTTAGCSCCCTVTTASAEGTATAQPAAAPAKAPQAQAPAGPHLWDEILRTYMHGDYFDYAGLVANAADRKKLARFLEWQGKADISKMSRADQIAFYINAYNSLNVKMIVEHYPVHSPIDIPGYFDKVKHPVAGENLTVSEAEYDRLIANYKDMRAHFAVVCSDRGCLPLRDRAWTGATLDADLDAAARKFVSDERHFKVDREKNQVWISKIFEWYGPKFTQDPKRPAERPEQYLKYWTDKETAALLDSGKYELKIIEWNWTINEKTGK